MIWENRRRRILKAPFPNLFPLQPNNSNMNKSILNRTTGPFGLVGGGGAGGLQNYQSVFGGIGGES